MTLLYTDPLFLKHETGRHPETADRLRAITARLEKTGLDKKCTAGTFKPLPSLNPPFPSDLAQTTTIDGNTVNYIVRVESGTIDESIYRIAIIDDPTPGLAAVAETPAELPTAASPLEPLEPLPAASATEMGPSIFAPPKTSICSAGGCLPPSVPATTKTDPHMSEARASASIAWLIG